MWDTARYLYWLLWENHVTLFHESEDMHSPLPRDSPSRCIYYRNSQVYEEAGIKIFTAAQFIIAKKKKSHK